MRLIHIPVLAFFVALNTLYLILLTSCHPTQDEKKLSDAEIRERMTNVNRIIVKDESKEIEDFIARHPWKMQTTGTGLRIEIYEKGNGRQLVLNDTVGIAYSVYLLDGTLCYSADSAKPMKLILGHAQQPGGLEEGLLKMHEGGSARMIVPSHLAYGMAGDENKIPSGSSLYYDVKLVHVGN